MNFIHSEILSWICCRADVWKYFQHKFCLTPMMTKVKKNVYDHKQMLHWMTDNIDLCVEQRAKSAKSNFAHQLAKLKGWNSYIQLNVGHLIRLNVGTKIESKIRRKQCRKHDMGTCTCSKHAPSYACMEHRNVTALGSLQKQAFLLTFDVQACTNFVFAYARACVCSTYIWWFFAI
jgi:hypothetical protein